MKHIQLICFLVFAIFGVHSISASNQIFIPLSGDNQLILPISLIEETDSVAEVVDTIPIKTPAEVIAELPAPEIGPFDVNMLFSPLVFVGYRTMQEEKKKPEINHLDGLKVMTYVEPLPDSLTVIGEFFEPIETEEPELKKIDLGKTQDWLKKNVLAQRAQADIHYLYMIENPDKIEYAIWDLPEPPALYDDHMTFLKFMKKQELPEVVAPPQPEVAELEVPKIHWLHKFNTGVQFSQAFISPNWYQGGNDYLSLLFNFNWNVQLNQAFHPNLLFQSDLQYKLALSSTPKGSIRKYQISDDAFQYNLNAGLKAVGNWYYSLNLLFKTQLFNNWEENSWKRTASFLSPGDLNAGLGMSYSRTNKLKTFQFTLTISPLSYNLKTCIAPNDKISHEQFNIDPNKKSKSEIGSNAEFNMTWGITSNISYKTRMFLFSDYHYFLSDWQNTFSFDINKFLSTQLFVHLRWDTSAESYGRWKKFMMREILSFGLSYTFSTK